MGDGIRGPVTAPVFLLNLAARRIQGGYREQDLPGHRERFERSRQLIGLIKWHDFKGLSIARDIEASRSKLSPEVFFLVLIIIGVSGATFIQMLTAKIKP